MTRMTLNSDIRILPDQPGRLLHNIARQKSRAGARTDGFQQKNKQCFFANETKYHLHFN